MLVLLCLPLVLFFVDSSRAATYPVTTSAATGPGSFEDAVLNAGVGDTITFSTLPSRFRLSARSLALSLSLSLSLSLLFSLFSFSLVVVVVVVVCVLKETTQRRC